MDTKDLALQFDSKHLIMWMIQLNAHNNNIKIIASKNYSYRPYHLLSWLVTVPETNKVTRNSLFTMVGLPPSVIQKNCINQTFFLWLPLTFVLWYEVEFFNWIPLNHGLILLIQTKNNVEDIGGSLVRKYF